MATFKRFEDILAWQKARQVTKVIYDLTRDGEFARDNGLRDQIRRSSVSIMANIAEGQARRSDKDFAHFLNISRSSVAEVQSHMYVALDTNYISQKDFEVVYQMLDEISRMTFSLAKHLVIKS
jgi:four helix bundle protein